MNNFIRRMSKWTFFLACAALLFVYTNIELESSKSRTLKAQTRAGSMSDLLFSHDNSQINEMQWQQADSRSVRIMYKDIEAPKLPVDPSSLPSEVCSAVAPTLLTPAQGAISHDLQNPHYSWSVVPDITEYIFQVSDSNDFTKPLITEREFARSSATEAKHTSFRSLSAQHKYFWRVASVCRNGQIGVFSDVSSFQTESPPNTECTLPPPTLLVPLNDAQVDTLIPGIRWSTVPGGYEYNYVLAKDTQFTQVVDSMTLIGVDIEVVDSVGRSPNDNLPLDTQLYWRVATICADFDKQGVFSEPFSFHTPANMESAPPPPNLLIPEDGKTTGSIRVTLQYTKVVDGISYLFLFYGSQMLADNNIWFRSITDSDGIDTAIFNPDETVFWRMKTRNHFGWGELSATRSFSTPVAAANSTIDPSSGGVLQPSPGYLKLDFPAGSVSAETTVNFRLFATSQQPMPQFLFANRSFALDASAGGVTVTQFLKPYTMVLEYDDSDLLAAGIADATQLNLVYWDGATWQPILPCDGCSIDTVNRTVTVVLDHFTEFALVAPKPSEYQIFLPAVQR